MKAFSNQTPLGEVEKVLRDSGIRITSLKMERHAVHASGIRVGADDAEQARSNVATNTLVEALNLIVHNLKVN